MNKITKKSLDKVLQINADITLPCRSCKSIIAVNARSCPHCGNDDPHCFIAFGEECESTRKKLNWIGRIGLGIALIYLVGGNWIAGLVMVIITVIVILIYKKTLDKVFQFSLAYNFHNETNKCVWIDLLYKIQQKVIGSN